MQNRRLLAVTAMLFGAHTATAQVLQLPAADKPLTASFTPVYTIGGSVVEEWAEFVGAPNVAFDGSGQLYIWDSMGALLAVTDQRGKLLRKMGRRGSGPGEFRMPSEEFAVLRNGTVLLHDLGKRVFLIYEPQGAVRELKVEFPDGTPFKFVPAGEQRIAYVPGFVLINGQPRLTGGPRVEATQLPVSAFTLDGDVRTVFRAWLAKRPEMNVLFSRLLLAPELRWAALSNGVIAVADTTTYTIKLVDVRARITTLQRPIPVRKTTDAERAAARAAHRVSLIGPPAPAGSPGRNPGANSGGRVRLPPEDAERVAQASPVYDEIQIIQQMAADWQDRLWIQRAGVGTAAGPVDVITASGSYIGTIAKGRIPVAFGPNGLVAFIDKDELDVPRITVQRLTLTPGK